jgi:hypothetical protein
MAEITFKSSLENYKMVYYHFLDNFINSKKGDEQINVINFIKNNNICQETDINIIISCWYTGNGYNYTFLNLNTQKESKFEYEHNHKFTNGSLDEFKRLFKYCIYPIIEDVHQTSLLIFEKDNHLYLLSFNSGLGNASHDVHQNNKELIVPYIQIKICDDISNNTNYESALHLIFNIFNIKHFYDILKSYQNNNYLVVEQKYYRIDWCIYILNDMKKHMGYIFDDMPIIQDGEKILTMDDLINDSKTLYIKSESRDFFLVDTDALLNENDVSGYEKNTYVYWFDEPRCLNTYYDYFSDIIKRVKNNNNLRNSNILYDTKFPYSDDILNQDIPISDIVLSKQIFHFSNENIYIKSQESGSCTWFSLYWPLIFYYVVNNKPELYIELIKKINNICYRIIQQIFTPDNFNKEYLSDTSDFIAMKKLCNKFIDIKLLDSSILTDENDFIYEIPIRLQANFKPINIYNYENDIITTEINNKIDLILEEINNKYDDDDDKKKDVIKFIIEKESTSLEKNIFIYKIFKTSKYKNMFKKIDDNFNIFEFITNLTQIGHNLVGKLKSFDDDFNLTKKEENRLTESLQSELYDYINLEQNEDYNFCIIQHIYFYNDFYNHKNPYVLSQGDIVKLYYYINKWFLFSNTIKIISYYYFHIYEICKLRRVNHVQLLTENKIEITRLINNTFFTTYINMDYCNIEYNPESDYPSYVLPRIHFGDVIYSYAHIRTIDHFNKERNFLYNYPKYINVNFGHTDPYVNSATIEFIQLNIFDIWKEENKISKDKLINYYLDLWWNYLEDTGQILILNDILSLLFFKTIKYNKLFKNYLVIIKKDTQNKEEFTNNVIKNINSWYIHEISNLINKYKKHDIDKNGDITIDKVKYNPIEIVKLGNIMSFFNCNNKSTYLININKNGGKLIIINTDFFIKIVFTKINRYAFSLDLVEGIDIDIDTDIKINKIFVNNKEVVRYKDIIYPFKYVIPTNCFHLIYLDNQTYKVSYFINSEHTDTTKLLLGSNALLKGYYEFSINPDTQFYLNKMSEDEYNNWINLCSDYQINKFNILYLNKPSDTPVNTGYYFNETTYNLINFKHNEIMIEKITHENYYNVKLLKNDNTSNFIDIKYKQENLDTYISQLNKIIKDNLDVNKTDNDRDINYKYLKSLENFFNKISDCSSKCVDKNKHENINILNKYKDKLTKLAENLLLDIKKYISQISTSCISELLNNYHILYNYLLSIKIYNFICIILQKIHNDKCKDICSLIKINNEYFKIKQKMFNYKFEVIFELIFGNELVDEQLERYEQIINSFIVYSNDINNTSIKPYKLTKKKIEETIEVLDINYINQLGGNYYPLHHFMMGKGKSAVITPLLSIYFSLIHEKEVYIIVPPHLKNPTIKLMNNYSRLFNIDTKVKICSDSDIKKDFLDGNFLDDNNNKIMLIDEFDSIINPIKSNYNLITEKNLKINEKIINYIIPIITPGVISLISNPSFKTDNVISLISNPKSDEKTIKKLLDNDIINIIKQITTNKIKENIDWGIHPKKAYAIPFRNKDKPLLNSNFSSVILTIVLTVYYYKIINNKKKIKILFDYIKNNNLSNQFFNIATDMISIKDVQEKINEDNNFIDSILIHIFSKIKLPEYQYNTSFIDIINIDNIFKIGYSGTVNIDLPDINKREQFIEINKIEDYDEELNIKDAIKKAKIININKNDLDLMNITNITNLIGILHENILGHDAIIDVLGLFKNFANKEFAEELYKLFEKTREIIFIDDNTDNKKVIINNNIEDYSESTNYTDPFIYYSQAHTVGIDIKQDNYPNLKGLCIIDKNSLYTDVAQGIFRLRKINLGHTVSFLFIK